MHAGSTVAAAATGPTAVEVQPAVGAVVLALAVAAALALAVSLYATKLTKLRPRAATIELRPETPAVVDMLTGGFAVEADAVPATVVHLAARGWFTIEDYGEDTIIRTRNGRPGDDSLRPYELAVLDHIEHHAIDGVVPTRVLTTGSKGVSKRWFKRFVGDVVHEAQSLGLCHRRWGAIQITAAWLAVAAAGLPAYFAFEAAPSSTDVADWASIGNLLAGSALVVAAGLAGAAAWVSRFGAQRDTPAGVRAAEHWLGVREFYAATGQFGDKSAASVAIWHDHLAYATAMGLAHEVRRQIPFESEHDRHAWSRATGEWRRVKVRYRSFRPGWGRHPLLLLLESLFEGAAAGAVGWVAWNVAGATWQHHYADYVTITPAQERWINLGAIAVAVVSLAMVVWAGARLLVAGADVFRRRTIEGEVVRARAFGGGDDSEPTYYLAIDRATARSRAAAGRTSLDRDTIVAHKVRGRVYAQVAQGARVRARVAPLTGYVTSVETLVPAPAYVRRMAEQSNPAPVVASGALGGWADKFGGGVTAGLGGLVAALVAKQRATLTDEQLDVVGPDGRTVRQLLDEQQAAIAGALGVPSVGADGPADGSLPVA